MYEIKVKVTKFADRKFWLMYYDCPLSGKRFTRSTKQTTERDAQKEAGKWEDQLNEGRYKRKTNVTWSEFREEFLQEHLADAPKKTFAAYVSALNAVERHCKVKQLAELSSERIAFVAKKLRKATPDGDGLSHETVRSYLTHLRAALNWAASPEIGMLREAPAAAIPKRVKGEKIMKGRAITLEEFERILEEVETGILACGVGKPVENAQRRFGEAAMARKREAQAKKAKENAPAWKRLLWGLWLSGLRIGELLNLSWDDENKILVDLSGKRPMLQIYAHQQKGRRDTLLPITPDFAEFLLKTPPSERIGPVFSLPGKRAGQLADPNYASRVVSAAGEAAGIKVDGDSGKYASAHDFRRAFGVRWASRVMPAVLKELMRHADIGTTMKYYVGQNAESVADTVWEAAGRVNTFVNRSSSDVQEQRKREAVNR